MRKKLLLLNIFLIFVMQLALVSGVDIGVNVTESTTSTTSTSTTSTTTTTVPPTATVPMRASMAIVMFFGGIINLMSTFVGGTPPVKKIELIIGGGIAFILILVGIGLILA